MKNLLRAAAAALVLSAACQPALAEDDPLGKCVVNASSAQDREAFMRWMFLALAANPSVKPMVNITDAQKKEINKGAATVMDRLLLKDCRSEAEATMRACGTDGVGDSFAAFGGIAMDDLMRNSAVNAALDEMIAYLDKDGWEALAKEAKAPPKP